MSTYENMINAIKDAPWIQIAKNELGVAEFPGDANNPRIIEYHSTTHYGLEDEKLSWCSSFVNWCIEQSGKEGTDNVAARSWSNWGSAITKPVPGCIAVLWREEPSSWKGHVGFYIGDHPTNSKFILLLGGNQNDSVCVSAYDKSHVLGFRWPK